MKVEIYKGSQLTGLLLFWPERHGPVIWDDYQGISLTREITPHWQVVTYTGERALVDRGIQDDSFSYEFLIGRSQRNLNRAIIVGVESDSVRRMLVRTRLNRIVSAPKTEVDEIITGLMPVSEKRSEDDDKSKDEDTKDESAKKEEAARAKLQRTLGSKYVISTIFAKITGEGHSAKTVAFWGDDLLSTSVLAKIKPDLMGFRIELRDIQTGVAVMSLGSRGEIMFDYGDESRLHSVEVALGAVDQCGLIKWK